MTTKPRNRTTQVGVWSALVGGALGFAVGMLFAPKRGPDARRRLAYQVEHYVSEAESTVRRWLGSGIESDAQRTRDVLVADAQERADNIRDDIDALLQELREKSDKAAPDA